MRDLTFHGGRLAAAARLFPHAPSPWLDLSTGINPHPWTPPARFAIDQHALPAPEALDTLLAAAGAAFGFAGALAAVPGSEIALRLLATLDLPRPWRVVTPCYRTHRDALPGATPIAADAVEAAAGAGGTLLLANPNNPDGRLFAPERLVQVARRLDAHGGVLVIDEAFADAIDGASILPLLGRHDPVVVLRSFGKFYGLAGIRLGFVAGMRSVVERIAVLLGGWPVSATALAYGTAAYRDADWATAMRTRLAAEAAALDALLAAHGFDARGACPLFRLIDTPGAPALFETLAAAAILTRPFDDAPHRLRLGLPGTAHDRLATALTSFSRRREPGHADAAASIETPACLDPRLRGDDGEGGGPSPSPHGQEPGSAPVAAPPHLHENTREDDASIASPSSFPRRRESRHADASASIDSPAHLYPPRGNDGEGGGPSPSPHGQEPGSAPVAAPPHLHENTR
ncbi:cobalamin biosynthetic protein CobC, partial [Sphingomonas sp. BE138]|uniref:aminotransferase class I/II-fold pyridoxal phosphate-dependent enzyme n=1 Tax=Sphingomonas sp. BE138 TaxID=2817845 RepID=UPI002865495E